MATTKPIPAEGKPLTPGKTLAFNDYLQNGLLNLSGANSTYGITAIGTNQGTAFQLNSPYNEVDTVTSSTGVNLPNSSGKHNTPYQFCAIYNNGANTLTVYAAQGTSDTINGTAGATGITMNANSAALFVSAKAGVWSSIGIAGNENFGAITVSTINGLTITTSTGTLTIPNGVTLTGPAASDTIAALGTVETFTAAQTFSGGFFDTVTAGTTAANFTNYGVTTFGSSNSKTFTLNAPVAGALKFLNYTGTTSGATGSTGVMTINSGSSAITFGNVNSSYINLLMGSSIISDVMVTLKGESATKWTVVSAVGYSTAGVLGSSVITLST